MSCKNATCVVWWSLRPHGCVFSAEDVDCGDNRLVPEGVHEYRSSNTFWCLSVLFLARTKLCGKMDRVGANAFRVRPATVTREPARRNEQKAEARLACTPPTFTNRVLGGAKRADCGATAALGAGSSQQGYASRPNLGLPAGAPVPPGGGQPSPNRGCRSGRGRRRRPNRGCPAEEQKRRCSSTSRRRSPSPTV